MFPTKIFVKYVNPIQDGPFRGCSRMWGKEGAKSTPLLTNLFHICYNYEAWHSYILPKEDPKKVKIT